MSQLVKAVAWKSASFGITKTELPEDVRVDSLEGTIRSLSCVKSNLVGKPILLFIESTEKKIGKGRSKASLTTQAKNSLAIEEKVFYDENCKVQFSSRLFTCLRMDLTKVNKDACKYLHSGKAPIVAVYDAKGRFVGMSRSAGGVLNYMSQAIKPQGVDLTKLCGEATSQLSKVFRSVEKRYNANESYKKIAAGARKKTTKSSRDKLSESKEKLDKYDKTATEDKAAFEAILSKHARIACGRVS